MAAAAGARLLIIGVANFGGNIAEEWLPTLVQALRPARSRRGLHHRLADIPVLVQAATRCGRRLFDVRQPVPNRLPLLQASGGGKRLLTVGTDCAVGKMFTSPGH